MSTSPKQNGLFEPEHRIDSEFQADSTIVLAQADSLETLRKLPDGAIKLVISSPPYNIGKEYEVQQKLEHYLEWLEPILTELVRVLSPGGSLCWQVGNYVEKAEVFPLDIYFYPIFKKLGLQLRNRIIWTFDHGLQEASISEIGKNSVFRWERQAPENGYEPKFQLQNTWLSDSGQKPIRSFKFNDREWEGYFFRVRTVEQNDQIVSAHYGKIRGGIEIEPRESSTCKITFTYYFNPKPSDRNLEWDMKNNLFGGLTDMKTPREP